MNNPITTISRERLEQLSSYKYVGSVLGHEIGDMARALLAVMDAKPTCWEIAGQIFSTEEEALKPGYVGRPEPLYETPPAPRAPDGWINCSDRLPENGETVLCGCFFGGPHDFRIKTGGLFCGVLCIVGGSWEVTHWMPMPSAPGDE